jgi:hypothetical protein
MKVIHIVISIAFLDILVCCSNKDNNHCFNGKIRYFDNSSMITKSIESKSVPLNGDNTGIIAVNDSLLICWSPGYPGHFFKIFNVDTGEEIGSFCRKGQGREEAISVNCVFQFFKKNDDIMTLLYASNEGKLFFWNISQSIKKGTTVYDTIVPYDNNRIFFQFYQSEDILFAYKPSEELNGYEATTPFYEKRTIDTNELIQDYPIYKTKSVENNNSVGPIGFFFYTWDAMKPDGSKIVQVMRHLPQINIIDTHTGDIVGYRMKNGPDFSLLKTDMESMNIYYNSVHADNNYIYATYWGKEPWVDRLGVELPVFNTIHVFDWNGQLLYELITDRSFFRVWSDPIRKRLYTIDMNTDEILYLDLENLN